LVPPKADPTGESAGVSAAAGAAEPPVPKANPCRAPWPLGLLSVPLALPLPTSYCIKWDAPIDFCNLLENFLR